MDNEVKLREEFALSGLPSIKELTLYKVEQVLIVRANLNGLKRAFELRSLFFKGSHDSEELLIVDLVIAFSRAYSL